MEHGDIHKTDQTNIMILIIDKGLKLSQITQGDSVDIFQTIDRQRPYLGKWLPFVEYTKELADTQRFVDAVIAASGDSLDYVFVIRKHDQFVGLAGFKSTDKQNKKTEIGYWLSEDFQKQGIMTRSVEKLCELAFHTLGLHRVQIKCAVANRASIQIPIRLGFMFEGIERDGEMLTGNVFTDLAVYSKLKTDPTHAVDNETLSTG